MREREKYGKAKIVRGRHDKIKTGKREKSKRE